MLPPRHLPSTLSLTHLLPLLLLLLLLLLSHAAHANFLDRYSRCKKLWHHLDPRASVIVRIADLAGAWPLEMAPWDFVDYVTRACPSDQRACFRRAMAVPGTIMLADDRAPVRTNVSVTLEGVFDVHRSSLSGGGRDDLVRMLALLLRRLYNPQRTLFAEYESRNPETNKTSVVYRPIYHAPAAIGVGVGFHPWQAKYWLSIQVDGHSSRPAPSGQCRYFKDHALDDYYHDLRTRLSRLRRLGYVKCLWPGDLSEPTLPLDYESPADKIVERDRAELQNRRENPEEQ
ncbi:hypothetical protein HRG_005090 [Hirsutella rhossiliensis]|uniref:Uncharacterized protein n=1 Tax=Hirsutella rhossiliensis TaxID=111463 RepID=A0A9P8N4T8_9HYPO|nr:uncharacterized protein HRG_05090 [Hirsutella rhossiliensis]KAH0964662.1 hypothetical protein HRG_05090 [Hirsutella rhossiliensis]